MQPHNAVQVQSNIKTSFFKAKDVREHESGSGGGGDQETTGENEGHLQEDNGSHDDDERCNRIGGTEPVPDDGDGSREALMEDSPVSSEEAQKLTSKERLANFAFTAH